MDLPSTVNAPRICWLGGKVYWVRALSIESMAILLSWLDDILPGKADRKMPPLLSDEASQAALISPSGQCVAVWLALRDQGVTFEQVQEMTVSEIEYVCLMNVLYAHRRTRGEPEPGGRDISETWCSKGMAQLAMEIGMDAVGKLSFDQFEWLMNEGDIDSQHSPQAQGYAQAMKLYEAAMAREQAANGKADS
jgi:hypothetical protein